MESKIQVQNPVVKNVDNRAVQPSNAPPVVELPTLAKSILALLSIIEMEIIALVSHYLIVHRATSLLQRLDGWLSEPLMTRRSAVYEHSWCCDGMRRSVHENSWRAMVAISPSTPI
jgi:hypothetical protein